MRYLIAGGGGQLARAFIGRFEKDAADFLAPGKSELDITDPGNIAGICDSYRPDVIINCAAYNLVDKAEEEADKAFRINASGPGLLARAAAERGAFFVHFSSDYVFDGLKESGLYVEDDAPNPINQYGKSKLRGERFVQEESGRFLIFRLSWVFGDGRNNFIHRLMEWAGNNEYLKITCDEYSVPTYTGTAVDITLRALQSGLSGLYHLTNSGFCSRYEWANLVLRTLGIKKFIRPVSMDAFNLPAKRPGFSAMSNERLSGLLGVDIPRWEDGVRLFLSRESRG